MKKIISIIALMGIVVSCFVFASCEKDQTEVKPFENLQISETESIAVIRNKKEYVLAEAEKKELLARQKLEQEQREARLKNDKKYRKQMEKEAKEREKARKKAEKEAKKRKQKEAEHKRHERVDKVVREDKDKDK